MLGIVEATFGGQAGYLNEIVRKNLNGSDKSKLQQDIELLKKFRERNKEFNDKRWSEMYE